MTILDTTIWIEFLRQKDETLSQKVIELLENRLVFGLSPIFAELLQGARNDDEERIILDIWENISKVNEDRLFLEAGKLSYKNKLTSKGIGIIDAAILVAAKRNQARLWTLDKKLAEEFQKM